MIKRSKSTGEDFDVQNILSKMEASGQSEASKLASKDARVKPQFWKHGF